MRKRLGERVALLEGLRDEVGGARVVQLRCRGVDEGCEVDRRVGPLHLGPQVRERDARHKARQARGGRGGRARFVHRAPNEPDEGEAQQYEEEGERDRTPRRPTPRARTPRDRSERGRG